MLIDEIVETIEVLSVRKGIAIDIGRDLQTSIEIAALHRCILALDTAIIELQCAMNELR